MKLLVLGGTVFLGRAIARHARDAGHEVTCAARGESGSVPDGVQLVRIDRDDPSALAALGDFDAVIDVARRPSHVRNAVAALTDRVGHWSFVSTGNVYADASVPGRARHAELLEPATLDLDELDMANYGRMKVACEQALPPGSFICRAGLIVGPEDTSKRFDYWVSRLDRGGEIIAPGSPDDAVQWIDVRDISAWLVKAAETSLSGAYDGVGSPITRAEFLAGVATGVGVQPQLTWIDQEFLLADGVAAWMGERSLPMWVPVPEAAGWMARDVTDSYAAGMTTRPLADTARDTLAWLKTEPVRNPKPCGLDADDEAGLLAKWHAA